MQKLAASCVIRPGPAPPPGGTAEKRDPVFFGATIDLNWIGGRGRLGGAPGSGVGVRSWGHRRTPKTEPSDSRYEYVKSTPSTNYKFLVSNLCSILPSVFNLTFVTNIINLSVSYGFYYIAAL